MELHPLWQHVRPLRRLMDRLSREELLNDREFMQAMRGVADEVGKQTARPTRAMVAAQAFVLAAGIERERMRTLIQGDTPWPCHDDYPPDATLEEMMAFSRFVQEAVAAARERLGHAETPPASS